VKRYLLPIILSVVGVLFFARASLQSQTNIFASITSASTVFQGLLDGAAPVTITTTASCNLGVASGCATAAYGSGYTDNEDATAGAAITYTLPSNPLLATGGARQYCVDNANNGSNPNTGTIEIATYGSGQYIIFTDGTLTASGGYVISGGAARDSACVRGVDSTHWMLYVYSGTWTEH